MSDVALTREVSPGWLEVESLEGDDAAAAINRLGDTRVVIGWSPDWAGFVIGEPSSAVYELRGFDETTELRWYRTPEGSSTTVLLQEAVPPGSGGRISDALPFDLRVTGSRMLVWGGGTGGKAVREPQIGELEVPMTVPRGSHLAIDLVEYVGRDPGSGTAMVIEERMTGLRVVASTDAEGVRYAENHR